MSVFSATFVALLVLKLTGTADVTWLQAASPLCLGAAAACVRGAWRGYLREVRRLNRKE